MKHPQVGHQVVLAARARVFLAAEAALGLRFVQGLTTRRPEPGF